MRLSILIAPAVVVTLAACGGSSSETPWPAEPETPALGPDGEAVPGDAQAASQEPDSSEQVDAGR